MNSSIGPAAEQHKLMDLHRRKGAVVLGTFYSRPAGAIIYPSAQGQPIGPFRVIRLATKKEYFSQADEVYPGWDQDGRSTKFKNFYWVEAAD